MRTPKPWRFTPSTDLPQATTAHVPHALQIVTQRPAPSPADDAPADSGLLSERMTDVVEPVDAAQIAAAMAATWHAIHAALAPVLGQRGVAGLYKRSVQLTSAASPWLVGVDEGDQAPLDLAALQAAFSQQPVATAAASGEALLQAFQALLVSLVGSALTDRLLHRVWAAEPAEPQRLPP